jgi:hypothetical protein
MDTYPVTPNPSPHPSGPAPKAKKKATRPIQYPIQMQLYINHAMLMSLQRICRFHGIPAGIGVRIALTEYLMRHDPQYVKEAGNGHV